MRRVLRYFYDCVFIQKVINKLKYKKKKQQTLLIARTYIFNLSLDFFPSKLITEFDFSLKRLYAFLEYIF